MQARAEVKELSADARQRLVRKAEDVVQAGFQNAKQADKLKEFGSQLSLLVAVCQSATCAEEIENYLRYQIGRGVWPDAFGDAVLAGAKDCFKALEVDTANQGRTAWSYYATYIKRSLVYHARRK